MGRLERFIRAAIKIASKSKMDFRHGAVLVKGIFGARDLSNNFFSSRGRIIGSGYNHDRVCINGQDVPSVHAEIDVLHDKTIKETKGSDMYIVRLSESGLANSKPCEYCLDALKKFQVRKVFYSTREGFECEKVNDMLGYTRPFKMKVFPSRSPISPLDDGK